MKIVLSLFVGGLATFVARKVFFGTTTLSLSDVSMLTHIWAGVFALTFVALLKQHHTT